MYTKEWDCCAGTKGLWAINAPDGDFICFVDNEYAADLLLSHLNR